MAWAEFLPQVLPWFDAVACSSSRECHAVRAYFDNALIDLPNVITPSCPDDSLSAKSPARLLFLGNLAYWPNRDALIRLAEDIFPAIQQVVPGVELLVVGGGADDLAASLSANRAIRWLGYVDDLDEVYDAATISIVPLRAGGGSRLKILEAFDRGIPVIATARAIEGLQVAHGEQVILAETPAEMATAVIRLSADQELANFLVQKAHEYVQQYHSPVIFEQKLHDFIKHKLL